MEEKHKDYCGNNFVGRHLLLGSMDPASKKSKSSSDEIVWKKIDLSLWFSSVDKFSEITRELVSIPRSPNYFFTPNLYSAVTVIPHWRR